MLTHRHTDRNTSTNRVICPLLRYTNGRDKKTRLGYHTVKTAGPYVQFSRHLFFITNID